MSLGDLYNKSSGVHRAGEYSARDVMLAYGKGYGDASESNEPFQNADNVPPPMFEEQQPDTYLDKLAAGRDSPLSLMQTLNPGKSYKPTETGNLQRSADKKLTDGNIVKDNAAGGMKDVQSQKAAFKADFTQAKAEVSDMVKDVAKKMGYENPDDVVGQMMAKAGDANNMGMLVGAVASAGTGGAGTALAAGYGIKQELTKREQQLPAKEQEAILKEVLTRLKETRAAPDSREEAAARGKVDAEVATEGPKQSQFAWEEMEMEDLAALMRADPEGRDQPEWEALMEEEAKLKGDQNNHEYVRQHYADDASPDKIAASMESGNSAITGLVAQAQVLQIDAGDVELAGAGVKGVGAGVTVADMSGIDTGGIAKDMNPELANEAAIKEQLHADVNRQFSA